VKRKLAFAALWTVVAATAAGLRLPKLGQRPMHADEAVQAARFRQLWEEGRYRYNPHEFHGPTLALATLPAVWLAGTDSFADATPATFRSVPVIFGVATVLLIWALGDAVGRLAAGVAGLVAALSPAMVFYSRYYIHETLLVFFTLAAVTCAWRYVRGGRCGWCLAAGACLGLVQATKETSVAVFFAMAAALGVARLWSRWLDRTPVWPRGPWRAWHVAVAAGVALAVVVLLLSSFFANPRGPLDGLGAYLPWLRRAGGDSAHVHPWYFYLQLLAWWHVGDGPWFSEALILALAAVGLVAALLPARTGLLGQAHVGFVRWVALYAVILTAIYSLTPYKTPWCLLGFLQAMILTAGIGAVALVRALPGRAAKGVLGAAIAAGAVLLGWQAYRANFVFTADACNPYLYRYTLADVERLEQDVRRLTQAWPAGSQTLIHVIWSDNYYWPIPWYLRRFPRAGYWTTIPPDPDAPLVVASPRHDAALTERLGATHLMTGYYGLRPGVLAQLWVRMDLWEAHLRRLGRL